MQFDSLHDFLAMGGYALYVWLSFGVSLLAHTLVWLVACRFDCMCVIGCVIACARVRLLVYLNACV